MPKPRKAHSDHLVRLDEAWNAYFASGRNDKDLSSVWSVIGLTNALAAAIVEYIPSGESRRAIAALFLCDKLSRVDLVDEPAKDDVLSVEPLTIPVAKADVRTLLWFVERQTEGVVPSPDMGGLSLGPATVESFGVYALRECAMRCLNSLLERRAGRTAVRRSRKRDQILETSIGWCEGAFLSEMREYGTKFKEFSKTVR